MVVKRTCFASYDHAVTMKCHAKKLSRVTDFSAFKNIIYSVKQFSNLCSYFEVKINEHLNLTIINIIHLVCICNVSDETIEHMSVSVSLYCFYPTIR
jgi:hypothetical protein